MTAVQEEEQKRRLERADLLKRLALHRHLGVRVVQRLPARRHHLEGVPQVLIAVVRDPSRHAQRLGLCVQRRDDHVIHAKSLCVLEPVEHELVEAVGHEGGEDDLGRVERVRVAARLLTRVGDGSRGLVVRGVRAVVHLERGDPGDELGGFRFGRLGFGRRPEIPRAPGALLPRGRRGFRRRARRYRRRRGVRAVDDRRSVPEPRAHPRRRGRRRPDGNPIPVEAGEILPRGRIAGAGASTVAAAAHARAEPQDRDDEQRGQHAPGEPTPRTRHASRPRVPRSAH